jgi:hypothetical protein
MNQSVFLYDQSVFLYDQSVFLYDRSVFLYDQSKKVRHTENFWGSGSYSKTVRPNGFFIYRRTLLSIFNFFMHLSVNFGSIPGFRLS